VDPSEEEDDDAPGEGSSLIGVIISFDGVVGGCTIFFENNVEELEFPVVEGVESGKLPVE